MSSFSLIILSLSKTHFENISIENIIIVKYLRFYMYIIYYIFIIPVNQQNFDQTLRIVENKLLTYQTK